MYSKVVYSKRFHAKSSTIEGVIMNRFYSLIFNIHLNLKVFYSDSDNVVYTNVTYACKIQRPNCSTIINIEDQRQNYSWVGAGESSLWNIDSLNDFCNFTINLYSNHLATLQLKADSGSMVVDMSILWLWWVSHHDLDSTLASRGAPFFSRFPSAFENAFKFAKLSLSLPQVDESNLQLCNGMDVVDRTGELSLLLIL